MKLRPQLSQYLIGAAIGVAGTLIVVTLLRGTNPLRACPPQVAVFAQNAGGPTSSPGWTEAPAHAAARRRAPASPTVSARTGSVSPAAANAPKPRRGGRRWYKRRGWYLFLDTLILSSPVTALIAVLYLTHPIIRERPRDPDLKRRMRRHRAYHRSLRRQVLLGATFATLSALGVFTFIMHLMDAIP